MWANNINKLIWKIKIIKLNAFKIIMKEIYNYLKKWNNKVINII